MDRLAEYCFPDGPGTLTISPGVDDLEPVVELDELDELEITLDELEFVVGVVFVAVLVGVPTVEFR